MKQRCCCQCVYAGRQPAFQVYRDMISGWGGFLSCVNHPDSPGVLREVLPTSTCRNFRARGERRPRTVPPDPPNDEVRHIGLTKGRWAIVDTTDYEWLSAYRWFACEGRGDRCYAATSIRAKVVFMHRFIMQASEGKIVDHIDGNGLNNRRGNLRLCTRLENARNLRPRKGTSSSFAGVYQRRGVPEKWYAAVEAGDEKVYLGPFDDEIEAARARDRKARQLHGEFAYLNFPEEFEAENDSP